MILIYGRMDDPPLSTTVEALQEAGQSTSWSSRPHSIARSSAFKSGRMESRAI